MLLRGSFCREFQKEWRLWWRDPLSVWQTQLLYALLLGIWAFLWGHAAPIVAASGIWFGFFWVLIVCADRFFEADLEYAALDAYRITPPRWIYCWIWAKIGVRYVGLIVPLVVMGAIGGAMWGLSLSTLVWTAIGQLLIGPTLLWFMALGWGLTDTLRQVGPLLAVLLFPLQFPMVLLGVQLSVAGATTGVAWAMVLGMMGCTVLGVTLLPPAVVTLLRGPL